MFKTYMFKTCSITIHYPFLQKVFCYKRASELHLHSADTRGQHLFLATTVRTPFCRCWLRSGCCIYLSDFCLLTCESTGIFIYFQCWRLSKTVIQNDPMFTPSQVKYQMIPIDDQPNAIPVNVQNLFKSQFHVYNVS